MIACSSSLWKHVAAFCLWNWQLLMGKWIQFNCGNDCTKWTLVVRFESNIVWSWRWGNQKLWRISQNILFYYFASGVIICTLCVHPLSQIKCCINLGLEHKHIVAQTHLTIEERLHFDLQLDEITFSWFYAVWMKYSERTM